MTQQNQGVHLAAGQTALCLESSGPIKSHLYSSPAAYLSEPPRVPLYRGNNNAYLM